MSGTMLREPYNYPQLTIILYTHNLTGAWCARNSGKPETIYLRRRSLGSVRSLQHSCYPRTRFVLIEAHHWTSSICTSILYYYNVSGYYSIRLQLNWIRRKHTHVLCAKIMIMQHHMINYWSRLCGEGVCSGKKSCESTTCRKWLYLVLRSLARRVTCLSDAVGKCMLC